MNIGEPQIEYNDHYQRQHFDIPKQQSTTPINEGFKAKLAGNGHAIMNQSRANLIPLKQENPESRSVGSRQRVRSSGKAMGKHG